MKTLQRTDGPRMTPGPTSNLSTSWPVVRPDVSVRRTARVVGVLFLAGYLAYGVGSLMAQGVINSADPNKSTVVFVTGAALGFASTVAAR